MKKIFENIENLRKMRNFSQKDLAKKLGIMQSAYSRMLTDTGDMKLSTLMRIAEILDVSIVDIITYPDKYEKVN